LAANWTATTQSAALQGGFVAASATQANPMTPYQYQFKWVVLLLAAVFGASRTLPYAQKLETEIRANKLLDTRIPEFELHNETLLDGLWKLARGPVPFGFGFERILKSSLSDPDLPDPALNIQLKDKSLREILDALCRADTRYAWSMDEATVDFFPRAIINDPSYSLNRELPQFELKNATDVQNGLLAIVRQLPPPVEQIAQGGWGRDRGCRSPCGFQGCGFDSASISQEKDHLFHH
jgi:hypothetical protein